MDESEADKTAILAVIRSETEAWLQRAFEALASYWVQSPQTWRIDYFASLGIRIDEGWDAIAARLKRIMERFPDKQDFPEHVRWEGVNVVVIGNMAWITYDQIGIDGLSPAQVRLARLIVDGHDLVEAAGLLAVSVNTLRTQLQRIFDKTGVRSQAALVRSLLSADAPNK